MYTLKGESFFNFNHETHCICYYVRERERKTFYNKHFYGWVVGWLVYDGGDCVKSFFCTTQAGFNC